MRVPGRIAIVGGGISGLLAAAELHRAGHEITLFEAAGYAGGHTNTVTVQTARGPLDVDTGFIVFNDRNYPNFEGMLAELGIASQPANMSFGVSDGRGRFEWAARGARGIFARRRHLVDPQFIRMLSDLVRFNREARELLTVNGSGPSLGDFLSDGRYSEYFVERLIVPQVSAVWSADPDQMWSFPASFLANFFENHGVLQLRNRPSWRTIPGGSRRYVEAHTAPFADRIRLRTPVERITRTAGGAGVRVRHGSGCEHFDEVVLACHADQALAMLAEPRRAERELLAAFPYQPNQAVLHTDTDLMPRRRGAWASWNFHLGDEPTGATTVTYDMNRLQSLVSDERYLVTLNRTAAIDPERVIRTIDYAHPVFTREGIAAQHRWGEISGVDRLHYCGAYWRWGFHEDGAWSALRVSEALGGRGPGFAAIERPDPPRWAGSDRDDELQPVLEAA
jgi:predicted NAD/FAD-binding protein